jgi:hypothetical protein
MTININCQGGSWIFPRPFENIQKALGPLGIIVELTKSEQFKQVLTITSEKDLAPDEILNVGIIIGVLTSPQR